MNDREQLTLREVALKASERVGGLQGRALDREAKRRGLTLSYTTVDRIIAGTYKSRPKGETIAALAQLSGYSEEQVRRAAGLAPQMRSFAEDLPPDADLLSPDQRRVVLDVVRQFARANSELYAARQSEAGEDRAQRSAPMNPAGESPAQDDAPEGAVVEIRRRGRATPSGIPLGAVADRKPGWRREADEREDSV